MRVLVPVKLTSGYTITFGAWLAVSPDDLRHAWEVWWQPEYSQLRLNGALANMLPGWENETYLKPLDADVLNPETVPYGVDSSDTFMRRLLKEEWAHEPALNAVATFDGR